jgi:hypothetical protein
MSTQYRLVQSGKTASGGCSAGQGSSEPVAPRKKKGLEENGRGLFSRHDTGICLEGLKIAATNLSQDSQSPDRKLKRGLTNTKQDC